MLITGLLPWLGSFKPSSGRKRKGEQMPTKPLGTCAMLDCLNNIACDPGKVLKVLRSTLFT